MFGEEVNHLAGALPARQKPRTERIMRNDNVTITLDRTSMEVITLALKERMALSVSDNELKYGRVADSICNAGPNHRLALRELERALAESN
jgi:hypothetical protein